MKTKTKLGSFQEYLDKVTENKGENEYEKDDNGWGFYIDIENQQCTPYRHNNRKINIFNSRYKYKYMMTKNLIKHMNVPETIQEETERTYTIINNNTVLQEHNNEKYILTILGIMSVCLFLILY